MDRAGKLMARLRMPEGLPSEHLLRAAWPWAAGKVIARHSRVAAVEGNHLVVDVEDELWRTQLIPLEDQILRNLQEVPAARALSGIRFRVRPLRRPPAQACSHAMITDEADGIADPVLRRLYRRQRARSSA